MRKLLTTLVIAIALCISPSVAFATGVGAICNGNWNAIQPQGGSPNDPTATFLPVTTGGPSSVGIVVIRGNDNAVWYTTLHTHPNPFQMHWQNSWVSIGGGTNTTPKVITTTDTFGNVTVRVRIIGLDGNTWETHGQNGTATGFRSWYLLSAGSAAYNGQPFHTGWNIAGLSYKFTTVWTAPGYVCN